jgi:hypothetical protein
MIFGNVLRPFGIRNLQPFGIVCGHLVHLFPFWYVWTKENLATLANSTTQKPCVTQAETRPITIALSKDQLLMGVHFQTYWGNDWHYCLLLFCKKIVLL